MIIWFPLKHWLLLKVCLANLISQKEFSIEKLNIYVLSIFETLKLNGWIVLLKILLDPKFYIPLLSTNQWTNRTTKQNNQTINCGFHGFRTSNMRPKTYWSLSMVSMPTTFWSMPPPESTNSWPCMESTLVSHPTSPSHHPKNPCTWMIPTGGFIHATNLAPIVTIYPQ